MADKTITVTIAGDASSLNAALGSAQKTLDKTSQHVEKTSKTVATAAKAFVLFEGAKKAAEFLKGTAEAAVENESAMRRVGVSVKNAGENYKGLSGPLDDVLEKMATTDGFVKTDLQESFAKLESVTKNHTVALKLEGDAMNVSAQRGISLGAATKSLMMSYLGSTTAGRKLGVITTALTTAHDAVKKAFEGLAASQKGKLTPAQKELEAQELKAAKAADKQATSTQLLDKIHKTFAGAVAARTDTMAGKLAIFQEKWQAIKVKIGDAIIPGLVKALDPILAILDKLSNLSGTWKTIILAVGAALTALTAGILIWTAATKAAKVAQEAWDAAMDANPIGIVVLAIAALTAAMIVLYERSATVRAIVNAAFKDIKSVGENVFGFFTQTLFPAFENAWEKSGGVVGTVVGVVKGNIKGLLQTVEGIVNLVGDVIHGRWSNLWGDAEQIVSGVITGIKAEFIAIPKAILTHLGDIAGAAETLGGAIFNGIVGAVQGLPGALGSVVSAGLSALKRLVESFHVTVKTKTYLGVPVPVGMSLGFGGGGGGPGVSLPSVSFAGAGSAGTGGLASPSSPKSVSFLHGNLPKVPGSSGVFTPFVPASTGGGSTGGGGGSGSASSALDALKTKLQGIADAATKVRDAVQSRMDAAFTHVKDFALKAFDGATQAGLQKLTDRAAAASKKIQDDLASKLQSLQDSNATLTPAEAALKALQDAHNQASLTDASSQAAAGLVAAQAGGDATAIAAAQKAVDDAAYNQRVADLSTTAAAERKAANDKLAIDTKTANDAATLAQAVADKQAKQDQLNYQASRDIKKNALDAQLADLQSHLDQHPKLWAATHKKVMKMFTDDFGPDFQTAGVNIGSAYISGLKQAFASVDPLTGELDKAASKASKATKAAAHPHLALGGIIKARPGGTLFVGGEAGRDEAIVPLPAGGRLGGDQHFHLNTTGLDETALARKIWRQSRMAVT